MREVGQKDSGKFKRRRHRAVCGQRIAGVAFLQLKRYGALRLHRLGASENRVSFEVAMPKARRASRSAVHAAEPSRNEVVEVEFGLSLE